jgi:GTP-binding protein
MDVSFITSAFCEDQYPPSDKPEIAFAGRSNVGKSSLINALVNRKNIAKTSSRPGRTQSINFFQLGGQMYLVDLPGYGYAQVPIKVRKSWHPMVETYLRKRVNLKAVAVILDIRIDPTPVDIELLNWLKHYHRQAILVLTKADKVSRNLAQTRANMIGSRFRKICAIGPTVFSAKTRKGRKEIWENIIRITGLRLPDTGLELSSPSCNP